MQSLKQMTILGALVTIATCQVFIPHFAQAQAPTQAQAQPAPLFYTQTVQFPHIGVQAPAAAPNTAAAPAAPSEPAQPVAAAPAPAAPVAPLSPSHYVTAFGLDNVFAPFGYAAAPQPAAQPAAPVAPTTHTAAASSPVAPAETPAHTAVLPQRPFYTFPNFYPFSGPLPIQRAPLASNAVNGQQQQVEQQAPAAPAAVQQPAPISAYTISNLPQGFNFPFYG